METRRSSPSLRLAAVLALIVMTVAGCGGTGPVGRGPAATVNGTEISRADLDSLIAAQRELIESGAAQARAQAESGDAQFTVEDVERSLSEQLAGIAGSGTGTISTDAASRQLGEMIRLELMHSALEQAGGEITDAQRQQARAELDALIQERGLDAESVPEVVGEHYIEMAAVNAALQAAVPDDIGEGLGLSPEEYEQALRDVFEIDGASYRQVCFFEVAFDDETSATEAVDRLRAGDDLADVAGDLASDNPELASDLDACTSIPAGSLVEAVGGDAFTAEAGDVFEPIEVPGFGADGASIWGVLVVDDVDVPEFEDVRGLLSQDFPNATEADVQEARQQYIDDLLMSVFDEAEVTIDPRFGTWDPTTASVVPPADPGVVPAGSWDEIYGSSR